MPNEEKIDTPVELREAVRACCLSIHVIAKNRCDKMVDYSVVAASSLIASALLTATQSGTVDLQMLKDLVINNLRNSIDNILEGNEVVKEILDINSGNDTIQ